jgi:hypothetical protein
MIKIYGMVLCCSLMFTFSCFSQTIIRLQLNDCNSCYAGLSIIRDEIFDSTKKYDYVFQSKYQDDSVDVIKKFNIKFGNCNVYFSDARFYQFSRSTTSELILSSPDTTTVLPLRFITQRNLSNVKTIFKQQEASSNALSRVPTDFRLFTDNEYYCVKNLINDLCTIVKDGKYDQYIKLNRDDLYVKIKAKYPKIDNGFSYEKIIRDAIELKPDLHNIHILSDSTAIGFANVFFINYYDSINTMSYITKRERFLLTFRHGKIHQVYYIDEYKLESTGLGVNEVGGFAMKNNYVWFATYVGQGGGMATADTKLCRYAFKGDSLVLDSILQLTAPAIAHKSHPAFYTSSLVSSNDYMAIRYHNKIYDKSGKAVFTLPLEDSLMLNTDAYKVNYAINSLAQVGDSVAVLYFAGGVRHCGFFNKSTGAFTKLLLPVPMQSNASLLVRDQQLCVVYLVPELKQLQIAKLK